MWTVVYIAPNRVVADMLKDLLEQEGILTLLRPIGAPHLGAAASVEILVPDSEIEEAHEVISTSYGK